MNKMETYIDQASSKAPQISSCAIPRLKLRFKCRHKKPFIQTAHLSIQCTGGTKQTKRNSAFASSSLDLVAYVINEFLLSWGLRNNKYANRGSYKGNYQNEDPQDFFQILLSWAVTDDYFLFILEFSYSIISIFAEISQRFLKLSGIGSCGFFSVVPRLIRMIFRIRVTHSCAMSP